MLTNNMHDHQHGSSFVDECRKCMPTSLVDNKVHRHARAAMDSLQDYGIIIPQLNYRLINVSFGWHGDLQNNAPLLQSQ